MSDIVFVLIHSPLVGPLTWKPVAEQLAERGYRAVVPILTSAIGAGPPYWRRHIDEIDRDLGEISEDESLVLVGHSGAGALLPVLGANMRPAVAAYLFVDAGIPEDSRSRFDLFGDDEQVTALRRRAQNGLLPPWNHWFPEAAMERLLPDAAMRQEFIKELQPTPLAVYEEPIPVPMDWPDASCSYLQLSAAYSGEARKARQRGWPVMEVHGNHLQMLVDPGTVADVLLSVVLGSADREP